jgi:hypothetical protein
LPTVLSKPALSTTSKKFSDDNSKQMCLVKPAQNSIRFLKHFNLINTLASRMRRILKVCIANYLQLLCTELQHCLWKYPPEALSRREFPE